jgi:hypothetical protein
MAIVRAVKTGAWSDVTVWNTGALPTSSDDVYSNTFTVTIDISPTVLSISNAATTGVTAGGSFVPTNGITLTCTQGGVAATASASCFVSSLTSGQSCAIVGDVTATSSAIAVNNTSLGTLVVTGNVLAGTAANPGTGVNNASSGTVTITGTVTGRAGTGAINSGTGTFNIFGDCIGGTLGGQGAANNSTGTMNHTGSIIANISPGWGPGVGSQNTFLTGPFIGTAQGVPANIALRWRWITSVGSSYMTVPNSTATGYKNLFTADFSGSASGQPAIANVRSGTVYGPSSELTGTCAVPGASSVASGVPVDNTTGTAYITETSIANALATASAVTLNQQTSSLNTSGSIGERLKLASTVATTAQQLSDALSNE